MPALDAMTLWLVGAGLLGSFAQAAVSFSRQTWTWRSVVQTVMGGLGGIVVPIVPGVAALPAWWQILLTLVMTYAVPDFTVNAAKQIAYRLRPPDVS